jgi:hypothetical protein
LAAQKILAVTTEQAVWSASANKLVVTCIADKRVGDIVASRIDIIRALQFHALNRTRDLEVYGRPDNVRTRLKIKLDHDVTDVIYDVSIVAGPAKHPICAGSTVQHVIAGAADKNVIVGPA